MPPPPPHRPIKTVAIQGHSQTDFHDRRGKSCPSRGVGGMLPQQMLKPRGPDNAVFGIVHEAFLQEFILEQV